MWRLAVSTLAADQVSGPVFNFWWWSHIFHLVEAESILILSMFLHSTAML